MKKLYTCHITTFIIFWLIRINYTNCILFLWPHTIQQITPIEKIRTDILIVSAISTTFILINTNLTNNIIKKNIQLREKIILYLIIKITLTRLIIITTLHNHNERRNIITWTRVKKSSLFFIRIITLLTIMTLYTHTRTTHIPLITFIILIRPRDLFIRTTLLFIIIIPLEIKIIIKTITKE